MFSVTSLGFLPFMALFVCLWYRVPQPSRWKLVLAANAVFCLSIDIGAFFAVALATAVVWQAAQYAQPEQPSRRGWLALGLAAALLPLLVLKYSGMLVPGLRDLYKPFGLAYYSLQLAGYLLDVWHGRTAPTPSYARLWCYAGFFLSLTQGPFNRYNTLMPQLEAAPKTFETQRLVSGLQRSAWGYFKKFAIADRAAIVVSAAFADPASFDRSQLIFATVMYSFQLYADFSGYTDIVLGMGEILGLHLPENFRQPFFSASVKELWARWHISLSQWFRDYVYIPLGGNRVSVLRWCFNMFVVWLLSGLWHGAGWNFALWGLYFGVFLSAEKLIEKKWKERSFKIADISANNDSNGGNRKNMFLICARNSIEHGYVLLVVLFSFVIFRVESVREIKEQLLGLAGSYGNAMTPMAAYETKSYLILLLIACAGATPFPAMWVQRLKNTNMWKKSGWLLQSCYILTGLVLATAFLLGSSVHPFLYFRF